MQFQILGALEIRIADRIVAVTSAKQRCLLITCLLHANQVVSVPRLVDAIWGDGPPATASSLVQTYVSLLRRSLVRPERPELIVTRASGYLIDVTPDELDLRRFEARLAEARAAAAGGDDKRASVALRQALAEWRGPALEGLETPVLRAAAARLEEMRLSAIEERIAAELRLGEVEPLAAELAELVAIHPLRERLRAQYMCALYQIGRQAEALDVYRRGHRVLRAELGVDPGPELRETYRAILAADVVLEGPRRWAGIVQAGGPTGLAGSGTTARVAEPAGRPGGYRPAVGPEGTAGGPETAISLRPVGSAHRVAPAQLPPCIDDLTGREAEFAVLRRLLESAAGTSTPAVAAIFGKAGTGKTTLALCVGQLVRESFPDGQLFVPLRGAGATSVMSIAQSLSWVLRALGVDPVQLPETVDERSALLRSMLAGRRMLIVIDDAPTEAHVRALLPAGPGSAVVVTSRPLLVALPSQLSVNLDVLEPAAARELLARMAGHDRVLAEPAQAAEIVALCGGLPLALRIAGARLAARRGWPLRVLAARLRDEHRRLDELTAGDLEVRGSLRLSYQAVQPRDRLAFRRLGMLGVTEFSSWLLAPLAGISVAESEQVVDRLADAQLLDHAGVGRDGQVRYRMHDLVRIFASECAAVEDPLTDQQDAVRRVVDWPDRGRRNHHPQRDQSGVHHLRDGICWPLDGAFVARLLAQPREWLSGMSAGPDDDGGADR